MPECRSCCATIEWVETPNKKRMPLDPERVEVVLEQKGRLRVVDDEGHVFAARFATPADAPDVVVRARVSHFSTCPAADEHRKAGR